MNNENNPFQDMPESTNVVFYKTQAIISAVAALIVVVLHSKCGLLDSGLYSFLLGVFTALFVSGILMFILTRILLGKAEEGDNITAMVVMEKKQFDEMQNRIIELEKLVKSSEAEEPQKEQDE